MFRQRFREDLKRLLSLYFKLVLDMGAASTITKMKMVKVCSYIYDMYLYIIFFFSRTMLRLFFSALFLDEC